MHSLMSFWAPLTPTKFNSFREIMINTAMSMGLYTGWSFNGTWLIVYDTLELVKQTFSLTLNILFVPRSPCFSDETWFFLRTGSIKTCRSPSQSFPPDGERKWGILMKLGVKEKKKTFKVTCSFWKLQGFFKKSPGGLLLPSACLISMFSTNNLLSITARWSRHTRPKWNSSTSIVWTGTQTLKLHLTLSFKLMLFFFSRRNWELNKYFPTR